MSDELKAKVQAQFGVSADAYATSDIHAKGESLSLLIEMTKPQPDWQMLDVATGAGHTAFTFAPYVDNVVATDLTEAMLHKTAELAESRCLNNITTKIADAESLPFDDDTFNLVTCRLAFHHFPNPKHALSEFIRVLKPGGIFALTDNFTVSDKQAAEYYNVYEKLRDPSHNWVYPLEHLHTIFIEAGFQVEETRCLTKEMEFHEWADRQHVSEANKQKLLEMMRNLPAALVPFFTPRWVDGTNYFTLHEAVITARLPK